MKNSSRLLIMAAALALPVSAVQSNAQSQAVGDDGIAASPKLRQLLSQQKARAAAPEQATVNTVVPQTTVAASPKAQQMQKQSIRASGPESGQQVAGYRATGSDGITASPKLRSLLDEHEQAFEIAPLK